MASRMARSERAMISSASASRSVEAELVHELEQPRAADLVAGDLGVDVAHHQLGRADVGAR